MTKGQFRIFRCAIAGVEAVEASTRHAFARHIHEQFGIGVIDHGAQKSFSCRGVVEAGPGHAITVNPGEVHDGAPIGDAPRSWKMLYFDPALIIEAVDHISEGKTRVFEFSAPVIDRAVVAARFSQLFSLMTSDADDSDGNGVAMLREELLLQLLADTMRGQAAFALEQGVPESILRVQHRIDADPAAPLALADLARESGLSRFQVLRGFSRATGLTPHAYIVQRRTHLARHLIARGTPLAEAALASGFADQSHMTRIFARQYGISPRMYAEAMA
jgi:AraC-like DNA-binding protein